MYLLLGYCHLMVLLGVKACVGLTTWLGRIMINLGACGEVQD